MNASQPAEALVAPPCPAERHVPSVEREAHDDFERASRAPPLCRDSAGAASDHLIEDFAGPPLDPARWIARSNGGTIGVDEGVSLNSGALQFPLVVSTGTPMPASGDFSEQ